jgi:hypothetical protein
MPGWFWQAAWMRGPWAFSAVAIKQITLFAAPKESSKKEDGDRGIPSPALSS